MAGVKITDLVSITEAASNDLLYIVDVSNTTQSPEGTSSQIAVGNMFSSGTYTPTVSGVVNAITATPNYATFIKVGSIVSCSIQLEILMDALETTGAFELSLPVASNFTNTKQLFGLMQWSAFGTSLAEIVGLSIEAETTNNTCFVDLTTANVNAGMPYCVIQFQYEIF
jgi:hypothetical protein